MGTQNDSKYDWLKHRWVDCRRLRKYSAYGITLTAAGTVLLYGLVSHAGVNKFLAQAILVPVVMLVVTFLLHRFRVFGDRTVPAGISFRRWGAVRLGGFCASKLSFILLVAVLGVPYLIASLLITSGLAGPSYLLIRDWAFMEETDSEA